MEADDQAEAEAERSGEDLPCKLAALLARRAAVEAELAKLEVSGETQLSRTDADARLLSKRGQTVAGYNVQIAVDSKHKLIVASAVVNDGNDTGQLHVVAQAAKAALGAAALQAVADIGYYNGETLRACEADAIDAFVPEPQRNQRLAAQGRFTLAAFAYDGAADAYRCPAGKLLRPMQGQKQDATGKWRIRYASRRADCRACPLRRPCLSANRQRREIERWVHEAVIERHRARMQNAEDMMRQRKALAEHPFGTLKCRAGYRHFLLRGFDKVRGEWSLMALCYNFTRVLSILGLASFVAYLMKRISNWVTLLIFSAATVLGPAYKLLMSIWAATGGRGATFRPTCTEAQ